MSDFIKKDVNDVEKLVSSIVNITIDISDDMNDRYFNGGIVGEHDDLAVIANIELSGYFKSKETLINAKNKDDIFSPLENIYYSYDRDLKNYGIRSYEDFEAIMLNDQSMFKELGVDSWLISTIMELYNNIEKGKDDYFNINVYLTIPLKDYTEKFGYDFRIRNHDKEDLISNFLDCDLYAVGDIYASFGENDENIFYGDGKHFKSEYIGTVDKHNVKNYVQSMLDYYNLK